MCNKLKSGKNLSKIGGDILISLKSKEQKYHTWSGFAQIEKLDWWLHFSKEVSIEAEYFTQNNITFNTKQYQIKGLLLNKNITIKGKIIGHKGTVRLLTRESKTDLEKELNKRFPVVCNNSKEIIFFEGFEQLELKEF